MKASRIEQKLTAMALCAVIIASIMPLSAIAQTQDEATWSAAPDTSVYSTMEPADGTTEPADGITEPADGLGQNSDEPEIGEEGREFGGKIIMTFDALEESVAQQLARLGAPLSALDLPHTLSATVDGQTAAVPVTWTCTPEYGGEAGEYIFTAVLGTDYTLAEGVSFPNITVLIKELSLPLGTQMKLTGEETIQEVVISQEQAVEGIAAAIETALNNANIATVVVTGSKTNINSALSINIPEGKTVIWKSVLKGSTANSLIALSGKGSFEVAESAEISASSGRAIACIEWYNYDYPSITVSGGEVKAVEGCAIYIQGDTYESVAVTVNGGIVSNVGSAENPAIHLRLTPYENSKVEVIIKNEGKVKSTGTGGIAIMNSSGDVLIQGAAEVNSDGTESFAIRSGSITVEGGTVTANDIALFAVKDVLVSGGVIRANTYAIYSGGRNYTTTIRGGSVQATGAAGYAVHAVGNVHVIDGTVTASGGDGAAIIAMGSVVVEGGTISASKKAVFLDGGSVRVCGGIVRGGSDVIYSLRGSVTVEGGKIEATDIGGCAIFAARDIHIKGGTVSANQKDGTAIMAMGPSSYVTIENGTVEAIGAGGRSVVSQSGGMLVKGGTVKAHNTAISCPYVNDSTLTVSGGKICADNTAIHFVGNRSTVAVNGGTISGGDVAIHLGGYTDSSVTVTDGTIIGGSNAIRLSVYMNPSVSVTGGMVLGCGSKNVTGNDRAAIYMESGAPVVTSPGAVIAWNKPAGNILYGLNTTADLASLPESTAKWSRMDDKSGISCGTDGFIEIDGISVVEIAANASGLDELQVDKAVNAAITYTLTGGSFVSSLNALDFAPEGLPDWLNITDTAIESNAVRIDLSGMPIGVREPLTLTLPGEIPAAHLTDGNAAISIPVSGTITIGAVAKGDGAAIADLTIDEITATEVTLRPVADLPSGQRAEYAVSETAAPPPSAAWQDSVSVSGLSPNTEYYAFARSKENENYAAGAPSSGIRCKTAKAELSGTVSISGTPAYGATITAVIGELYSTTPGVAPFQLGALSYQWWRRSPESMAGSIIPSATNSTYTLTEDDIGNIIRVEVMAENCEGAVSGTTYKVIDKAKPLGTPAYTAITGSNQTLAQVALHGSFVNPHNSSPVSGALRWDALPETYVERGKAYSWIFIPEESATYHAVHGSIIPWRAASRDNDSNSYDPPAASTITPGKAYNQPVAATAPITAILGNNAAAKAPVPHKTIVDAIAKAQTDAKAQGKTANGTAISLNVTLPQRASSLTTTLTQSSLSSLVSAGVTSLELKGAPVAIRLDLPALKEIHKQSSGNIDISIAPTTVLTAQAKAMVGNRPLYNITISTIKNGDAVNITNLATGTATLSIPYTPGITEAAGYLFGVYVDGNGKATRINGSAYDANAGAVLLPVGHFSVYGVGYTQPSATYIDISTHWGKEAIDYVVDRGILSGISETAFAPNTAITRGALVSALGRLAGVDAKAYTTNSFTDVKADSALSPYIEWAYKKGVVQGIGNRRFDPDRAITREEIAVIFSNYAEATGYTLPVIREVTDYADAASIGSTCKTAVAAMQQAGIMMGSAENKLNPKSNATRAEASAMLYRYIKVTIDPATAQGWALNDFGKWMYYENGKVVTGKKEIDGSTYTFDQYGVTADVPRNLRHTTYTVQKGDSFWSIARKLGCPTIELERLNNKSRFSIIYPGDVLRVPEK